MSTKSPHVVVVGGGVAGSLAAIAAQKAGAQVSLICQAGGATPAWSGAVDVACDLVGSTPGPLMPGLSRGGLITENVRRLAALRPRHPYARLRADVHSAVDDALVALSAATPELGLCRRSDGHNHVLATTMGTVKRAALVPASQHLDLADLTEDTVVGIVEWRDLAGFNAAPVVEMLQFASRLGTTTPPFSVVPIVVPRVATGDVFRDAKAMARALTDDETRGRFVQALKAQVDATTGQRPTHLLVPASLSADALGDDDLFAIDADVGVPVRELLAMPPSVPGHRLGIALRSAAVAAGVTVVDGSVADVVVRSKNVVSVVVRRGADVSDLACDGLVHAAGRFYGGGLVRDHSARERLFDLPVMTEGRPVDDQFIGTLTGDHVDADHAIFRAGVHVDEEQRPLDRHRERVADNVVVAGSIIEGYDPARDGSGLGVAATTGHRAGVLIAAMLRGAHQEAA
jgi:glycerol-3-phosphate dehydrogenase subunit B